MGYVYCVLQLGIHSSCLRSLFLFPQSEAVSISFKSLVCGLNQQNLQDMGNPQDSINREEEGPIPSSGVCNSLHHEVWTQNLKTHH